MTLRYSRFTNINGHRVEFSASLVNPQDRHFHRESESQKAQLESSHPVPGDRKDVKTPIKRKMT